MLPLIITVVATTMLLEIIKKFIVMPKWLTVLMPAIIGGAVGCFFPFTFLINSGYSYIASVVFTGFSFAAFSAYAYDIAKKVVKDVVINGIKGLFGGNYDVEPINTPPSNDPIEENPSNVREITE